MYNHILNNMIQKFTVKKENGKLIFHNFGGYETRNPSVIWCIERADEIYKWNDFDQIEINTSDSGVSDCYSFTKGGSFNRLVPDFNFHSWPQVGVDDYEKTIKEISEAGLFPAKKLKVGWIGSIETSDVRKKMFSIGEKNTNLFEIISMTWLWEKRSADPNKPKLDATQYMSMCDLVKTYGILIDAEGYGYSGRLKYLLWSRRPLLLIERPYAEFFNEYLKPWEHYIPVKRDLSDLIEKTKMCIRNYKAMCMIAEKAYQFSKKNLTRDACYRQWNKIIEPITKP
jgi:hypothetical protein